jgi:hypothetical protein
MKWTTIQPTYGGPYKALSIGSVNVGRVSRELSGGGYCAYCKLPSIKEWLGSSECEEDCVKMLEEAVTHWLRKANLKEN